MAEPIEDFAKLFGTRLRLDRTLIFKKGDRLFLLSRNLKNLVERVGDWLFAGLYLGKIKGGIFLPSFSLLSMIAEHANNRVVVDDKAAWLFICSRDIFKEGLVEVYGSKNRGVYTLVFNRRGECLGFGEIVKDLDKAKSGVVIKNVLDVGDFLRRERTQISES
jgi:ribosome biogenesis protein Nip4